MSKGPEAFRTISEVAEDLDLPQHVLRFWETRFAQIKPLKRGGGRRYYRPDDVDLLRGIRQLLYDEGYTIKGVQRILRESGSRFVIRAGRGEDGFAVASQRAAADETAANGEDDDGLEEDVDYEVDADTDDEIAYGAPQQDDSDDAAPHGTNGGGCHGHRLSGDDIETLQAALAELVECKRLLDQNR